jgi:hypothetical protein
MASEGLNEKENKRVYETGLRIYENLKAEYPDKTNNALDLILNSLCMALTCLIHEGMEKDNRAIAIQMVHKILTDNC